MKTLKYSNETEKQILINRESENGLTLFEDQKHNDGDFLVFATTKEVTENERECAINELNRRGNVGKNMGIIEDVVSLLVDKGVFTEDELPQGTRDSLVKTRNLRAKI